MAALVKHESKRYRSKLVRKMKAVVKQKHRSANVEETRQFNVLVSMVYIFPAEMKKMG
jgi:hypothetical protein